jgi:pro-sigmaK processing inhibitor BofA
MLYKPLKKLLVFAFNCIISCGLIWLINISLGWAGITLGINIVTATVGGLLGVPGIILMLSLGAIV